MRRTLVLRLADALDAGRDEPPLAFLVRAVELAVQEGLTPRETVALVDELESRTGLCLHPREASPKQTVKQTAKQTD